MSDDRSPGKPPGGGGPRPDRSRRGGGFGKRRGPRPDRGDAGRPERRGGQAGAVNRSRPVYEERRSVPRRGWASGNGPRSARRGTPEPPQPPPLPSDPREAALRILHAVDTRGTFSDILLDAALPDMSIRPKAGLDGRGILVHMCTMCHNDKLDQTISRAQFEREKKGLWAAEPAAPKDSVLSVPILPIQTDALIDMRILDRVVAGHDAAGVPGVDW